MEDSRKKSEEQSVSAHSFTVAARIKPIDSEDNNFKIVVNKNYKEMHIEANKAVRSVSYGARSKNFKMNKIFKEQSSNKEIFKDLVEQKLGLLKNNCNISVMAYGATNSGKTYTVFGDREADCQKQQGLAYLCGDYLINTLFKEGFKFYFSYL